MLGDTEQCNIVNLCHGQHLVQAAWATLLMGALSYWTIYLILRVGDGPELIMRMGCMLKGGGRGVLPDDHSRSQGRRVCPDGAQN